MSFWSLDPRMKSAEMRQNSPCFVFYSETVCVFCPFVNPFLRNVNTRIVWPLCGPQLPAASCRMPLHCGFPEILIACTVLSENRQHSCTFLTTLAIGKRPTTQEKSLKTRWIPHIWQQWYAIDVFQTCPCGILMAPVLGKRRERTATFSSIQWPSTPTHSVVATT